MCTQEEWEALAKALGLKLQQGKRIVSTQAEDRLWRKHLLPNEKGKGSELGSSQSEGLSTLPGRCRGAVTGTLESRQRSEG